MSAPASDHGLSIDTIAAALREAGCVFAAEEAALLVAAAPTGEALRSMVGQRAAGQPLEHVIGWAEFCGLRMAVDPGVFVPRRRSEFLVRQAAALCRPGMRVVDLACGCGAIGAAIATLAAEVELHACDVDQVAVRCARRNLLPFGSRVYAGDLFQPLPDALRGRVGVIAANLPYVPAEQVRLMPAEARTHEPLAALDGGPDGLDVLRRAAARAGDWLAPGGHLLIEIGAGQAEAASAAFTAAGLTAAVARDTELDATVITGRLA
jgi:release factor glutamine methyltransferase